VGAGADSPGEVLIFLQGGPGSQARVGLLTVRSGPVTQVPYDPSSAQELKMVEDLEGWSRTHGDKHVYVEKVTKLAMLGTIEWVDVFYSAGDAKPVDVSNCDGTNCGQPSLSQDNHPLVFVKASLKCYQLTSDFGRPTGHSPCVPVLATATEVACVHFKQTGWCLRIGDLLEARLIGTRDGE